ncbi:hypothetical protein D3C78_1397820 [compost metagenome]
MLGLGKRRLSDPRHAFAAHLAERLGLWIDPCRHVVAANTGQRTAARRDFGRGVVWATGAVVGHALHQVTELAFTGQLCVQHRQAHLQRTVLMQAQNTLGQSTGDHCRRQVVYRWQQPTGVRQAPLALVVKLADDARTHVSAPDTRRGRIFRM